MRRTIEKEWTGRCHQKYSRYLRQCRSRRANLLDILQGSYVGYQDHDRQSLQLTSISFLRTHTSRGTLTFSHARARKTIRPSRIVPRYTQLACVGRYAHTQSNMGCTGVLDRRSERDWGKLEAARRPVDRARELHGRRVLVRE